MESIYKVIDRYESIISLIHAIANNDQVAVDDFISCLGGTVFRYIRYRTSGHMPARSIAEKSFIRFIYLNRQSKIDQPLEFLFEIVEDTLKTHISYSPGKGLSKKQFQMIQVLESLSISDRIAVELILDSNLPVEKVSKFLKLNENHIKNIQVEIIKKLAHCDDDRRGDTGEKRRAIRKSTRRFQKNPRINSQRRKYREHKRTNRSNTSSG